MSGIVSYPSSDISIQDGREHWYTCMIGRSDGTRIGRASIENVVEGVFGAGKYELKDHGTTWWLATPSSLTQVRSFPLKRLKMTNILLTSLQAQLDQIGES